MAERSGSSPNPWSRHKPTKQGARGADRQSLGPGTRARQETADGSGSFRPPRRRQTEVVDLDDVADELYGLPPDQFVATRDARAASARADGDRALAQEITKLRRPSASAWLANLLSRQYRAEVDELLDLGPALREAQEQLAGDRLRQLSQRRLEALDALSGRAESIARGLGQPVTAHTVQEVDGTLQAALADPAAAEAVRRGRLTTALAYSGFGTLASGEARAEGTGGAQKTGPGEGTRRAEAAATAARQLVGKKVRAVEVASRERDRRRARLEELESQVEEARTEAAAAGRALKDAEQQLVQARREAAKAESAVRRASAD
jgi:hypothetical protein